MDLKRITDWTPLPGASIDIWQQGTPVSSGHVDGEQTRGGSVMRALARTK